MPVHKSWLPHAPLIEEFSQEDLEKLKSVQCLSSVLNNPNRTLMDGVKSYFQTSNFADFDIGSLRNSSLPEPNINDFKAYFTKIEGVYKWYKKLHSQMNRK